MNGRFFLLGRLKLREDQKRKSISGITVLTCY
jgi:hypothetical protein